jgi:hypothetical protein
MTAKQGGVTRTRFARAVCAALTIAAVLGLSAVPAGAAWSPFTNVVVNNYVRDPQVAMDPAGNAVFVWRQDEGGGDLALYTRSRSADGSLSPIQRLAPRVPEFAEKDLAVDSQGNAYFVWRTLNDAGVQIRARVRSADGTLGPVRTLKSCYSGGEVTVGAYGGGNAVFAWTCNPRDGTDMVKARSMSASGSLGAVSTVVRENFPELSMGVDSQGNATFVWEHHTGEHLEAFSRVLAPNGDVGPVERVSPLGDRAAFTPKVAVTPSGRAIFSWAEYQGDPYTFTPVTRARAADGSLQPMQVLSRYRGQDWGDWLALAVAPTGEAVFCWLADGAVHARTRAPGGALGPAKTIAAKPYGACQPGIDAQGNVVITWDVPVGSKNRVFTRSLDPAGDLGPTRALSPAGHNAHPPVLAMTPAGAAAVAWAEGGKGFAIQASFGP